MLSFGSNLQEVWTGRRRLGVCGAILPLFELVHCGELFTVSCSVVSLLHALSTAAHYPLPSTEELPRLPGEPFCGELIAVFNWFLMFPPPTLQLSTLYPLLKSYLIHLVKSFSGELIAIFNRFLMFPLPSLPTLQLSILYPLLKRYLIHLHG